VELCRIGGITTDKARLLGEKIYNDNKYMTEEIVLSYKRAIDKVSKDRQ
jgi:hypothetical protein